MLYSAARSSITGAGRESWVDPSSGGGARAGARGGACLQGPDPDPLGLLFGLPTRTSLRSRMG